MGSSSRAVVIGGGMAGLASCRVLADLFDTVVVLERDNLAVQQVCFVTSSFDVCIRRACSINMQLHYSARMHSYMTLQLCIRLDS